MNHLNYTNNENICNSNVILNQKLDDLSELKSQASTIKTMTKFASFSNEDFLSQQQQSPSMIMSANTNNQDFDYKNRFQSYAFNQTQSQQPQSRNIPMFNETDSNYSYTSYAYPPTNNMNYQFNTISNQYSTYAYQPNYVKNENFNLQLSESPSSLSSSSSSLSSSTNINMDSNYHVKSSQVSYLIDPHIQQQQMPLQQQHNSYFNEDLTKLNQPLRTSSSSSLSSTQSNNYVKQQPAQKAIQQSELQNLNNQMVKSDPEVSTLEESCNENNTSQTSTSAVKPPVIYAWMKKVHLNNTGKLQKFSNFVFSVWV